MADVIIIGNGPAGISAALYTLRAGLSTTIIGKDEGSLKKSEKIENYYGFPEPIEGSALVEKGIAQAKRLGADIVSGEVVGVMYDGKFAVKTKDEEFAADSLILATGSSRTAPPIKGLKEFEGRGVSYCAVCDAFFYRGKDVAVLGNGEYAAHEAAQLMQTSGSVTILTNGKELTAEVPAGVQVITKEIEAFSGDDGVDGVVFKDETTFATAGVFVALGVAGSTDLAKTIGALTEGKNIAVDENMATNIPGLFAAGDCTGGMLQVAKAVYEGAKAGTSATKFIRSNGGK